MAEPFVGQITVYGFNFAPRGWLQCNGQTLAISQYTALFSLLGTYYGGNGTSNFQVPNFQGNVPVNQGTGSGLSPYSLGQSTGVQNVTITSSTMAGHNHSLVASTTDGNVAKSAGNQLAKAFTGSKGGASYTGNYLSTTAPNQNIAPTSLSLVGGNQPHNNMQPYLALNFCIALTGVFPSRN
jgi:microcystin-dependent protein